MHRYLYVFFLLNFGISQSQDSIPKIYERSFKENTVKKYTNKDFNYQEILENEREPTLLERIKKWLVDFFKNLFGLNDDDEAFNLTSQFLNYLAIIIIIIVVYFIAKALLNKEGNWLFSSKNKNMSSAIHLEENINVINFAKDIEKAKSLGQNRQVIRLYYLWLLKTFSDKEYIKWDKDKTNADYLLEINNEKIKAEFAYLSYLYNYTWYGVFEMTADDFLSMNESFEKTLKSIGV